MKTLKSRKINSAYRTETANDVIENMKGMVQHGYCLVSRRACKLCTDAYDALKRRDPSFRETDGIRCAAEGRQGGCNGVRKYRVFLFILPDFKY